MESLPDIEAVIDSLLKPPGVCYGREEALLAEHLARAGIDQPRHDRDARAQEYLEVHGTEEFPSLLPRRVLRVLPELRRNIEEWWPKMEAMPRTLIHNDCNPRNLCLRKVGKKRQLVAYDWEVSRPWSLPARPRRVPHLHLGRRDSGRGRALHRASPLKARDSR